MDSLLAVKPELVWGLFTRGLGVVFLISFTSLSVQVVKNAGREGGLPIAFRLAGVRRDFPTIRRFFYFPTLLWLSDSDAMLQALTFTGLAGACTVVYGGQYSFVGILVCYLSYLSLDMAVGLIFPWDCLLFESTVLALFLPATRALPALEAVSAPAPALAWAYRLLLFRVMFGFGKQKFIGSTSKDLAYLKGFLIGQPLPSPLGWYVQKLPTILLKPLVLFMFFTEIPAPCFALVPGVLSLVCAACTVFLMIGIQSMGSFGYFSILTINGCIPLLDNTTPGALHVATMFSPGAPVLVNAFVLLHTASACFAFLFNSWVGQTWHMWSFWYRLPRVLQLPFDLFRLLHPFRWLHPYGVFPPNTGPGVKMTLLVEVSWDKRKWHEIVLPFSPTNPKSPPKFIAPHHPRGDQAVIYETFGLNPTSLISSMAGPWDPYAFGLRTGADVFLERILEGKGNEFVKGGVLAEHAEPPVAARVSTVMLEAVDLKEHFATGNWWKRTYVGPHAPPRERDPHFWQDFLPEPETWHFDAIFWRKRTPSIRRLMERSRAGNEDPMALAIADGGDLGPADVERFWNEFVPLISAEERANFDTLADVVPRVRARFARRDLRATKRLLGRFSLLLVARLEPMYLNRWLEPEIPAKTYFHLWMVTQHIIGKGREAYLRALENPRAVVTDALSEMTDATGLYLLAIFRYETMIFESQKLRLIDAISAPHDLEEKRRMRDIENMTPGQQKVVRLVQSLSGFACVFPFLRDAFQGSRFDSGYPELYPTFRQLDSGEVVLRAYREPPPGMELPVTPAAASSEAAE
jgi:hypothetical protein